MERLPTTIASWRVAVLLVCMSMGCATEVPKSEWAAGDFGIEQGDTFYGETIARVERSADCQIGYFANGTMAFRRVMENGLAHGISEAWYPSGQIRYSQSYGAGLLSGRSVFYDEQGRVTSEEALAGRGAYAVRPHAYRHLPIGGGLFGTAVLVKEERLMKKKNRVRELW